MLASIYIGAALGQHKVVQSVPTYEYSIVPPHPSDRQIQIWDMDATEPMVSIRMDGRMAFSKSYKPDAAAQTFWDAMARNAPCRKAGE